MFSKIALLALALVPASLAQISTDFESGWDQATWPIYAPDCNQGGKVSLDTTKAHSGKNSIKVAGAGGYCGHIFFGTTKVPSGDVYVRAWLQASVALTSSHVSFITMTDSAQSGKHLRIGGQSQILMYNRETDDATLPDLSPNGIAASKALPTGSWQCFEYHLGTDGTIETWLNGDAITGLTSIPGKPTSNNGQWQKSTIKPKPTGIYFGWESYGGDVNTFWYDDISIQSTRIGCGASTSAPTTMSTVVTGAVTSSVASSVASSAPSSVTSAPVSSASSSAPAAPTSSTVVGTVAHYGQCGGQGWTGATACVAGYTCKATDQYYSQCL